MTAPRRLVEQAGTGAAVFLSPDAASTPPPPACSPPCAAEIYERIEGACCTYHGFSSDEVLKAHIRAVVLSLIALRNAEPRMARSL